MKKNIVLDVDGVILDFDKGFQKSMKNFLNRDIKILKIEEFDMRPRLGLSNEEFKEGLKYFYETKDFSKLEAYDGAINTIKNLEKDYNILYVTGIPEEQKNLRIENLQNLGVNADNNNVICTGFGISDKSKFIKEISPIYYVDDLLSHLHDCRFVDNLIWIENAYSHIKEEMHDLEFKIVSSLEDWFENYINNNNNKNRIKIK